MHWRFHSDEGQQICGSRTVGRHPVGGPKERGDCGGADAGGAPLRGSGAQVLALLQRHRGQAPPQTTATQPRTRGEAGGSTKRPVERGVVCGERNGSERGQGRERRGGGTPRGPGAAGGGVSGASGGGRASAAGRAHRTSSDEARPPSKAAERVTARCTGANAAEQPQEGGGAELFGEEGRAQTCGCTARRATKRGPPPRQRSGSPPAAQGRMRRSSRRRGCERSFSGRKGERRRAGASHVERRSEDPLQGSGAGHRPLHRGECGGAAAGGGVSGAFRGGRASADVRVHRTSSDEARTPSKAAERGTARCTGADRRDLLRTSANCAEGGSRRGRGRAGRAPRKGPNGRETSALCRPVADPPPHHRRQAKASRVREKPRPWAAASSAPGKSTVDATTFPI